MNLTAYSSVHTTLFRIRGKASKYTCECGNQANEWAYNGNDPDELTDEKTGCLYSTNLSCYTPMCLSCHRRMDKKKITHCPHGHEYTKENTILDAGKRKCKTCVYTRNRDRKRENPLTPEQRARKTELQRLRRAKQG